MKICRHCAQLLPIEQFRRMAKNEPRRSRICGACHARYEMLRNRKKRQVQQGWAIHKSCSRIAKARTCDRAMALLEILVAGFGGPAAFGEIWYAEVQRLRKARRPTTRLARMYDCAVKLAFLADQQRRETLDTASPEELEAAMRPALLETIRRHPEIAVDAAAKLGARVEWPATPVPPA